MRVNKLWANSLKGENTHSCKNETFKKREKNSNGLGHLIDFYKRTTHKYGLINFETISEIIFF